MAITFSSTAGTSGITTISVTATSRSEMTNLVKNFTLANSGSSLPMHVVQLGYVPIEKYVTISPSAITWDASGGTGSITINSNDDWVVVSDGWINLSAFYVRDLSERHNTVYGNGNTIIGVSCYENIGEARTGGITAYCQSDSSITATTTVSQAGDYEKPYIMLGVYSMVLGSESATTAVSVSSNVSWSADTDSNWITLNTVTGTGNGNISFSVSEHLDEIDREGYINVFNNGLNVSLMITQTAPSTKPYIIVSPTSFNVDASGSTNTISVSANCDYDIAADSDWIAVGAASGSGNGSVSFTTQANSGASDVGNIEFSNIYLSRFVTVQRSGVEKYLSASTNSITSSSSGGSFEVSVYSNVNWSVSVDMGDGDVSDRWLSVSPSSGSNNGSIRISVGSGTTEVSGSVVLSSTKYGLSYTISVEREEFFVETKIYYTSTGGTVINPVLNGWGANITSNVYENGQGVITFDGVATTIPASAFISSSLSSIIIPDTIETVGIAAFNLCSNITGLTMGSSIKTIGDYAFSSLYALSSSIELPETLETLGEGAFYLSSGLTGNLVIPDSVTSIETAAFYGCENITGLTIGNSVTTIGRLSFGSCTRLTGNLVIPNSVTTIKEGAFYATMGVTCLTIGNSVDTIENNAFNADYYLNTIYAYPLVQPTVGNGAFFNIAPIGTLHYPIGSDYSTFISALPSGWTAVADL